MRGGQAGRPYHSRPFIEARVSALGRGVAARRRSRAYDGRRGRRLRRRRRLRGRRARARERVPWRRGAAVARRRRSGGASTGRGSGPGGAAGHAPDPAAGRVRAGAAGAGRAQEAQLRQAERGRGRGRRHAGKRRNLRQRAQPGVRVDVPRALRGAVARGVQRQRRHHARRCGGACAPVGTPVKLGSAGPRIQSRSAQGRHTRRLLHSRRPAVCRHSAQRPGGRTGQREAAASEGAGRHHEGLRVQARVQQRVVCVLLRHLRRAQAPRLSGAARAPLPRAGARAAAAGPPLAARSAAAVWAHAPVPRVGLG